MVNLCFITPKIYIVRDVKVFREQGAMGASSAVYIQVNEQRSDLSNTVIGKLAHHVIMMIYPHQGSCGSHWHMMSQNAGFW